MRYYMKDLTMDEKLERWPLFYDTGVLQKVINNVEQSRAFSLVERPSRNQKIWSLEETMALDVLSKRDLNCSSMQRIINDIFSLERTVLAIEGKLKDNRVRGKIVPEDPELRSRMERAIDESQALKGIPEYMTRATHRFLPDWVNRCNRCRSSLQRCRGGFPCESCVNHGRPCTRILDDHVIVRDYPEGRVIRNPVPRDGVCGKCTKRNDAHYMKEPCDGNFPCNNCKTTSKNKRVVCTQLTAEGGTISYTFNLATEQADNDDSLDFEDAEDFEPSQLETWTAEDEDIIQESLSRSRLQIQSMFTYDSSDTSAANFAQDPSGDTAQGEQRSEDQGNDDDSLFEGEYDFPLDPALRHATVNMVTTTPLRNSHCYLTQAAVSYGPEPKPESRQ
ncbi:hypothetical protein LTR37_007425 [Vermiconidia calcicola]|uniref:Uncharacterized protein n=1 Tax=Vermiconidia calcicola TaxID=1690605 RepID=A0ACC3NDK1_9PEZI|nr:hypothetical protein LTR37_007425 [Vermiconidia calcicola]